MSQVIPQKCKRTLDDEQGPPKKRAKVGPWDPPCNEIALFVGESTLVKALEQEKKLVVDANAGLQKTNKKQAEDAQARVEGLKSAHKAEKQELEREIAELRRVKAEHDGEEKKRKLKQKKVQQMIDEEKQQMEQSKQHMEQEKEQMKQEKEQMKQEKEQMKQEKHQMEREKKRMEREKKTMEREKQQMEQEKQTLKECNLDLLSDQWKLQKDKAHVYQQASKQCEELRRELERTSTHPSNPEHFQIPNQGISQNETQTAGEDTSALQTNDEERMDDVVPAISENEEMIDVEEETNDGEGKRFDAPAVPIRNQTIDEDEDMESYHAPNEARHLQSVDMLDSESIMIDNGAFQEHQSIISENMDLEDSAASTQEQLIDQEEAIVYDPSPDHFVQPQHHWSNVEKSPLDFFRDKVRAPTASAPSAEYKSINAVMEESRSEETSNASSNVPTISVAHPTFSTSRNTALVNAFRGAPSYGEASTPMSSQTPELPIPLEPQTFTSSISHPSIITTSSNVPAVAVGGQSLSSSGNQSLATEFREASTQDGGSIPTSFQASEHPGPLEPQTPPSSVSSSTTGNNVLATEFQKAPTQGSGTPTPSKTPEHLGPLEPQTSPSSLPTPASSTRLSDLYSGCLRCDAIQESRAKKKEKLEAINVRRILDKMKDRRDRTEVAGNAFSTLLERFSVSKDDDEENENYCPLHEPANHDESADESAESDFEEYQKFDVD